MHLAELLLFNIPHPPILHQFSNPVTPSVQVIPHSHSPCWHPCWSLHVNLSLRRWTPNCSVHQFLPSLIYFAHTPRLIFMKHSSDYTRPPLIFAWWIKNKLPPFLGPPHSAHTTCSNQTQLTTLWSWLHPTLPSSLPCSLLFLLPAHPLNPILEATETQWRSSLVLICSRSKKCSLPQY